MDNLLLCPLFKGIEVKELELLFKDVDYKTISYKKNEIIVSENEICNRLIILTKGNVRGEMTDYMGKVIKIEDIETFRPLAPAFLFGMKNRFPVSIIANEKVEILTISQAVVLQMFQANINFLTNFLNIISNRAQFLSQKIKFLSFQTIKGKLAHYLMQFDKNMESIMFTLPASQKEMAELFGVTRPALGRAIRELDRDGLIKANGKNVRILDFNKINEFLR